MLFCISYCYALRKTCQWKLGFLQTFYLNGVPGNVFLPVFFENVYIHLWVDDPWKGQQWYTFADRSSRGMFQRFESTIGVWLAKFIFPPAQVKRFWTCKTCSSTRRQEQKKNPAYNTGIWCSYKPLSGCWKVIWILPQQCESKNVRYCDLKKIGIEEWKACDNSKHLSRGAQVLKLCWESSTPRIGIYRPLVCCGPPGGEVGGWELHLVFSKRLESCPPSLLEMAG